MGMVFFEYLKKDQKKHELLINGLIPNQVPRGFMGGIILQAEGLDRILTSKIEYAVGNESSKYGGIAPDGWSQSKEVEPGKHVFCLLNWNRSSFANFAFDLIAVMNGTYRPGFVSSFHGLSFALPPGTE